MNVQLQPWTLGAILAVIVLIVCILLAIVGQGPSHITLALLGVLAVARLT